MGPLLTAVLVVFSSLADHDVNETPTEAAASASSTNERILADTLAALVETSPTLGPALDRASAVLPAPVVMYSTQWCTYCRKAKDWLSGRGVEFIERDIEEDPDAANELARKALAAGIRKGGVPIFDVDGELVIGFDVEKLEALLEAREQ